MQRLLMIGMNHATAPLAVREKFAFSAKQREQALARFREKFPEAEVVLVSTCNRVELYTARPVHSHPRIEEMVAFVAEFHGIEESQLAPHVYERQGMEVANHLFTVTSSLDSLVVGETQILGQVREAYEISKQVGSVSTLLHPLFQRAIAAARDVMAATGLTEGRRSIASIAVEYARQIFDNFGDKSILSVGAGKMSTLVLQHFSELHVKKLIVCNRDLTKAEALAQQFGGTSASLEKLADHLVDADIVITSTASPVPIISRGMFEQVMKRRRWRRSFLVDIALPRDIDEAVGEIDNVYLYNIDDLQQVASATDTARQEAVERARVLVRQQVSDFITWHRAREVGPMIEQLFSRSHAIAKEEVSRTANKLPDLSAEQRQQLEELARRIVNKILNDPIQAVRNGGSGAETGTHVNAFAKLFNLGEPKREQ